jgi:hypothetical protein
LFKKIFPRFAVVVNVVVVFVVVKVVVLVVVVVNVTVAARSDDHLCFFFQGVSFSPIRSKTESCRSCTKCGKNEEAVKNCTRRKDTECKLIPENKVKEYKLKNKSKWPPSLNGKSTKAPTTVNSSSGELDNTKGEEWFHTKNVVYKTFLAIALRSNYFTHGFILMRSTLWDSTVRACVTIFPEGIPSCITFSGSAVNAAEGY